jgi:hypothetical protein
MPPTLCDQRMLFAISVVLVNGEWLRQEINSERLGYENVCAFPYVSPI